MEILLIFAAALLLAGAAYGVAARPRIPSVALPFVPDFDSSRADFADALAEEIPPMQTEPPEAAPAPTPSPSWRWRGPYDALMFRTVGRKRTTAALMKALARQESSFNANAVNPERSAFSPAEILARLLADDDGGEAFFEHYDLNPSIGLMQMRWSTARALDGSVTPRQLLDPATNLRVAKMLMVEIASQGFTLDTIDVWNVGAGANWKRGVRNLPYRDRVRNFYNEFVADFPPDGSDVQ